MLQSLIALGSLYITGFAAVWAERAQKRGIRGGRVGTWKWPVLVLLLLQKYWRRET